MKNAIIRTLSGILFVGIMVVGLLLNKYLFGALFLLIMIGMMIEFYRMTFGGKFLASRTMAIITGAVFFVLLFCNCAFGMPPRYVGFTVVPLVVLMAMSLYSKERAEFWMFSHFYTGILYIAVPLSLANLIAFRPDGFNGTVLLNFFIIIWASDVGAYVAGTTLGKRWPKKLFPEISPKKSWAGFWGGMVLAVVAAVLLQVFGMFDFPLWHAAVLGVVMHVAGVYGDLFESQWKRTYDMKDSGSIIPGHGGLLDRFDSTLMAFPAGVVYLLAFGLI